MKLKKNSFQERSYQYENYLSMRSISFTTGKSKTAVFWPVHMNGFRKIK